MPELLGTTFAKAALEEARERERFAEVVREVVANLEDETTNWGENPLETDFLLYSLLRAHNGVFADAYEEIVRMVDVQFRTPGGDVARPNRIARVILSELKTRYQRT